MATLTLKFIGDDQTRQATDSVADGLRGVGRAADESAPKGRGFFAGMLQTAGGFLAAGVIGGIAGQFGELARGMVAGNAEFERYQTQFGVLLGSADAAKARIAELAEFGAKTPFELPEVVRADKVLQAFGLHSEEAAQKFGFSGSQIRTIAGDMAAGSGASFEEISGYLGKFAAGATGEAIARFQELGVVTRDELAAMGVEFSKSGELTSPLPEAMNKLLTIVQSKYGGMMDAQSKSFEGMMSNLQDWIGQTLRSIGQPIFEVLKDRLGDLLAFLGSPGVQAAIATFAIILADGIGGAITLVGQVIAAVQPIIVQLQTWFASAGDSSGQLAGVLGFLGQTWQQLQVIIGLAIELINATVVPIFGAIGQFLGAHSREIEALLRIAWENIQVVVSTVLGVIQGLITTVLAVIRGDWQGAWEGIKGILETVWNGIRTLVENALRGLQLLLGLAWEGIKTAAGAAWEGIKGAIAATWDEIKRNVSSAVNALPGIISGIGGALYSAGAGIFQQLWDGLSAKWGELKRWFDGKLQELRDLLPFSEPRDPASPLRGLQASGAAIVGMLQQGIDGAGPLAIAAPRLAGATVGRGRLDGGLSAGGGSGTVRIVVDDRGAAWLRNVIRIEIDERLVAVGRGVDTRGRTR